MPYLLDSICTIIGVFYKYAQHHRGSFTLKRREMKRLIQKEFAEVIKNPHDPRTVELMFQMLDTNADGLVDFSEYLLLIFRVAKACYSHLKLREGLLKKEETRTAPCGEEPQKNERDRHQVWDDARRERNIHERGDSDQRYLHQTRATAQRQERRDYLLHEPLTQVNGRSHQVHNLERRDLRGRDHLSYEHQKQKDYYVGRTQYGRQAEVEKQVQNFEPQRDDVGHRQVKERQPAIEEDHQHQPRDLLQGHKTDECQNQTHNPELLERYDSLPREHERRPQLPDPEWEQRKTKTCETECRERPRSSALQSREAEHREDQRDEPELREVERRRFHFLDQDEGARSYSSQPIRRVGVKEQQGSYASEHTHREEKRLHPSDPEPMYSKRRSPQPYGSETTESDKRRIQQYRQADPQEEESEKRRPHPFDSESSQHEYKRSLIHGREDNQRREQYYEPESWERENTRGRTHDFKPRQVETETAEAWEPDIRKDKRDLEQRRSPANEPTWRRGSQGRQQYYESKSWEQENERTRRPPMHDSEPRDGERRRPQVANLRQDEKERTQSTDFLIRKPDQARSYSSEHSPRRINQSREQIYEFDPRETKRRTHQLNDVTFRDGEQHRQMYRVTEVLKRDRQVRSMTCKSECRGPEPSGLQRCYPGTREGEVKGHVYQKYMI